MADNKSGSIGVIEIDGEIKIFDIPLTCLVPASSCAKGCKCGDEIGAAQEAAVHSATPALIISMLDALYGKVRKPEAIYPLKGYELHYTEDRKAALIGIAVEK